MNAEQIQLKIVAFEEAVAESEMASASFPKQMTEILSQPGLPFEAFETGSLPTFDQALAQNGGFNNEIERLEVKANYSNMIRNKMIYIDIEIHSSALRDPGDVDFVIDEIAEAMVDCSVVLGMGIKKINLSRGRFMVTNVQLETGEIVKMPIGGYHDPADPGAITLSYDLINELIAGYRAGRSSGAQRTKEYARKVIAEEFFHEFECRQLPHIYKDTITANQSPLMSDYSSDPGEKAAKLFANEYYLYKEREILRKHIQKGKEMLRQGN